MLHYSQILNLDYASYKRHWHAQSSKYAGCDHLVTAMDNGWEASDVVSLEERTLSAGRRVRVYHFQLERGGEAMTMPVICNPFVERFLSESAAQIVALNDSRRLQRS